MFFSALTIGRMDTRAEVLYDEINISNEMMVGETQTNTYVRWVLGDTKKTESFTSKSTVVSSNESDPFTSMCGWRTVK